METINSFRTRPAAKRDMISSQLRDEIVQGRFAPGCQLPTRSVLEREFGVSSATLQRALDQLIEQGFVYARGSSGTYVSDNPPFLSRYGLVFPYPHGGSDWSRFWLSLRAEAERFSRQSNAKSVPVYYGSENQTDTQEYDRLVAHLREHRFAGLIFAGPGWPFRGTPVLEMPGVPRVMIGPATSGGIPLVNMDPASLLDRALDHLCEAGCRRVGVLGHAGLLSDPDYLHRWTAGVARRGMVTDPRWALGLDVRHPTFARNATHLLMSADAGRRPDGLFIADDNLVEYATTGLVDAGLAVPSDIRVVAHCNFPWPTPSLLPVRRLGFDTRQVLRACIEVIDRQRAGETPSASSAVEPQFEDEIGPSLTNEG